MKFWLLDAFSLNMIQAFPASVDIAEVSAAHAAEILCNEPWESAVEHAETAAVFSNVLPLGHDVPCNRATVNMGKGDGAIVGQYSGPRLPEGATSLPEGAAIKWLVVAVN